METSNYGRVLLLFLCLDTWHLQLLLLLLPLLTLAPTADRTISLMPFLNIRIGMNHLLLWMLRGGMLFLFPFLLVWWLMDNRRNPFFRTTLPTPPQSDCHLTSGQAGHAPPMTGRSNHVQLSQLTDTWLFRPLPRSIGTTQLGLSATSIPDRFFFSTQSGLSSSSKARAFFPCSWSIYPA